jgi:hypothetical protein
VFGIFVKHKTSVMVAQKLGVRVVLLSLLFPQAGSVAQDHLSKHRLSIDSTPSTCKNFQIFGMFICFGHHDGSMRCARALCLFIIQGFSVEDRRKLAHSVQM